MRRSLALLYGILSYAFFFAVFIYAIGFVAGFVVPKTVDNGTIGATGTAIGIDLSLLSLFALQHSVMARKQFKEWWSRYVPREVERSTFVLFSSLALALLFWQWQPLPQLMWHVSDPVLSPALIGLSLIGWLLVLFSTFLINHFELFGLQQVVRNFRSMVMPKPTFRTPLLYRVVRHPLYLGFIIAFWATPTMSAGHMLFASVTTAYILIAIQFEERDLIELFGEEYRRYVAHVPMIVPRLWARGSDIARSQSRDLRSTTTAE